MKDSHSTKGVYCVILDIVLIFQISFQERKLSVPNNMLLSSELVTDCLVGKRFNEQGLGRGEINCLRAPACIIIINYVIITINLYKTYTRNSGHNPYTQHTTSHKHDIHIQCNSFINK